MTVGEKIKQLRKEICHNGNWPQLCQCQILPLTELKMEKVYQVCSLL